MSQLILSPNVDWSSLGKARVVQWWEHSHPTNFTRCKSRRWSHMWVQFVVGSHLCSEKFSSIIGSLSSDVFERRTSTGSEVFSLLTRLDDIKFVFLSFFTVIEAIWLKICAKPPSKNEKRPLPVDVRRSKTLLLKLHIRLIQQQNGNVSWRRRAQIKQLVDQ